MSENAPEIHVLNHKVRLLQAEAGFRTSLDSVFVAAACRAEAGDRVLDLGAGVGGASFCLLRRVAGVHVTGIEIQQSHADLAVKNIALNEMQGRAEFIVADIRDWRTEDRFDHVICNPPYLDAGTYTPSPSEQRAKALGHSPSPHRGEGRGEEKATSEDIERARKLRKNTTEAEQKLWHELRDRRFFNLKFKRQHPVSPYIVDFCCLEKGIIVELDGGQHVEQEDYDRKRTEFLEAQGFRVVRFWNNDVLANMGGVLERMEGVLRGPSPNPLPGGE
ncbi:MAG TPA: DUF559 domain-containing protein, partial [Micavibrio sp.]|nr:DUF559 domain-containing protein [Micavibrio sp.]